VTITSPGAQHHIEHFGCIGPVKAAVESLVIYLAVELGAHNIQVNALSAGPLYGELMNSYPDSERLVRHWEGRAPDHRLGEEREVVPHRVREHDGVGAGAARRRGAGGGSWRTTRVIARARRRQSP
jgi:enoyl-[acyl-carrier-protein] reductase (NADH)